MTAVSRGSGDPRTAWKMSQGRGSRRLGIARAARTRSVRVVGGPTLIGWSSVSVVPGNLPSPGSKNGPIGISDETELSPRFSIETSTRRGDAPFAVAAIAPSTISSRKVGPGSGGAASSARGGPGLAGADGVLLTCFDRQAPPSLFPGGAGGRSVDYHA